MANPLRKTMVYLGLAEEDLEFQEQSVSEPTPVTQAPRATVTPLRKGNSTARNVAANDMNEILTVHPRQYRDAPRIAEAFREGIPVIINLSQMSDGDARRLIDFASGLSQGLSGKIERVTSKVFLLSPAHIAVSGYSDDSEARRDNLFGGE